VSAAAFSTSSEKKALHAVFKATPRYPEKQPLFESMRRHVTSHILLRIQFHINENMGKSVEKKTGSNNRYQ
jgi:hypothetical protein